jgi:hypothetical protein
VQDPKPSPVGPANANASAPPPAQAVSTETVTRPDPGLARGRWEAPRAAFYGAIALVVLIGAFALLARLGVLRLPRAATRGGKSDP